MIIYQILYANGALEQGPTVYKEPPGVMIEYLSTRKEIKARLKHLRAINITDITVLRHTIAKPTRKEIVAFLNRVTPGQANG